MLLTRMETPLRPTWPRSGVRQMLKAVCRTAARKLPECKTDSVTARPLEGPATRMRCSHQASFHQQVNFLRRPFLQDDDLPFTNPLTEEVIGQALTAISGWLDRIFSG